METDKEAIISDDLLNDQHINHSLLPPVSTYWSNTLLQTKNRQQTSNVEFRLYMIEETIELLLQPFIVIAQFKIMIQFTLQWMLELLT